MAFSQKHSGRILVPYFNKAEWNYVNKCLNEGELKQALEILKIWKLRTPLLSAGIQGTLILLESALIDEFTIPEEQKRQIRAIALQRFLNVSVNNDKQGTFNKLVSKDFPKWIIDLRHDISHGHELPSHEMLQLALSECFRWIQQKYWQEANDLKDFIQKEEECDVILEHLTTYVKLNIDMYNGLKIEKEYETLMNNLNYLARRYNTETVELSALQQVLEEMLNQELSNPDNKAVSRKVAEIVVDIKGLFCVRLEKNENDIETIPKTFRQLWSNLLNLLFDNGFLEDVLLKLLESMNTSTREAVRKLASLWLSDILNGLIKLRRIDNFRKAAEHEYNTAWSLQAAILAYKCKIEKESAELRDCTEFSSYEGFNSLNLINFENQMKKTVNKCYIQFLDKIMILNNYPEDHVNFMMLLFKQQCGKYRSTPGLLRRNVYTLKDLPFDLEQIERIPSSEERCSEHSNSDVVMVDTDVVTNKRWKRVIDVSMYKNCPLGLLPHQDRSVNPLIPME